MSILLTLAALVAAGMLLVLALGMLARRSDVVMGLILGTQVLWLAVDGAYIPTIAVSGLSIYLPDMVFVLVGLAALLRVLGLGRLTSGRWAVIVAVVSAGFAMTRGIATVALDQSVNESRPTFYFLSGALYFMTVPWDEDILERLSRVFLIAAGSLCVLVVILWGASLTWAPVPRPLATPVEMGGFRVIGAGQALILGQALLIVLPGIVVPRHYQPLGRLRYLAFVLFPIVVLLQHRTVWAATAAGILVLALRSREQTRRGLVKVIGAGGLLLLSLAFIFGQEENPLVESLQRSGDTHTFEWRVEGWIQLLEGRSAPEGLDILYGTPFGLGYEREVFGTELDLSPHNFYVEVYLRQGAIGLGALILMYGLAIRSLRREPRGMQVAGFANADVLIALAATQLVFFMTYSPEIAQGAVAGIIFGVAARASRAARQERSAAERDRRLVRATASARLGP